MNRVTMVGQILSSSLAGVAPPTEVTDFVSAATRLRDQMSPDNEHARIEFILSPDELRLLRTALSLKRRATAEQVQQAQQNVVSASLSRSLASLLHPLDGLLRDPSLVRVSPRPVPSLASFLSPEGRHGKDFEPSLAEEVRDPKHRILLSPSLIVGDLNVFRKRCEDRGLPLAVVFADLDDFKAFNVELGEGLVDRLILPQILSAVESASLGHGRAYRHGGDEFVLLFPNANLEVVESLVRQLKICIESLTFDGTALVPRLSAGVWIAAPTSHLTALELVDRASEAKKASKVAGKSRITIRLETGSEFSERIVSHEQPGT